MEFVESLEYPHGTPIWHFIVTPLSTYYQPLIKKPRTIGIVLKLDDYRLPRLFIDSVL
jgi:hypothetical protein